MSKLEVNAVEPQCGTNLTLGASGDTIIIPSGATISNQGTAAGFGPTGAVSWNTTKITADPNPAVTGVGYFADTTSAAFTITLPATPAAGAVIGIADYANTFATNNLTVGRNGSNIGGVAENATLKVNGVSVTFVYVDATQGWIVTDSGQRSNLDTEVFIVATGGTVTCCGNYKIHTFTGPGTFTVSSLASNPANNITDYLVVAGGGGGAWDRGGGGGAGGFRESVPSPAAWTASPLASPGGALPVSVTAYPITVGGGGAGGTPSPGPGVQGNPSVFSTITSAGGGLGEAAPVGTAGAGGSGGGAAGPGTGGAGNTPPTSPSQGSAGGSSPGNNSGGGGGGATAVGQDGSGPRAGGAGATTSISASPTAYAGGGGGGFSDAQGCGTGGAGGTGGGGKGGDRPLTPSGVAVAGTTNRGGGGGGGANGPNASPLTNGAAGGSGIVIIRYKFQ
jgi:hypothetical protein